MNSRLFKICSLILSFVLLINMLPLNVWAEEMDTVAKVETQTETEPAQAEVLGEVIEKRTQYTKDYRLNNGFYVSAVYAEPVHFEEDGQWEEIDNTLKAHSDGTYGNTAGVWDVRFPQMLTKDRNVTITKDGYTLSFGMAGELRNQGNLEIASIDDSVEPAAIGAADMDATVIPTPLETTSINIGDKAETFAISNVKNTSAQILKMDDSLAHEAAQYEEMVLTKTTSGLMYNNVYGTTDIQYDLQSNKVKESVILESYDADLRGFRYNLDVGELVPVLNDDGSIDFYDTEEESIVMTMPAPFLVDDAMVTNHDIRVILNGSDSNYTLIYMLPQSWLAAEERAWPVILDPDVMAESTTMNIQDHTVMQTQTHDYQWGMLQVGKSASSGNSRIYLGFDSIPNLTSADVIVNATVGLYRPSNGYSTTPVTVHKVPRAWNPATITWSSEETNFVTTAEDYALVIGKGWYYWDVTDIVRGWYTGANTGMMFKATDDIENSSSTDSYKQFYSCNYGSLKPLLQITYRNNNGLESYWDYTSSSAGRAGTGHINSYTGNLTWVRSDIGFSGNRMPVNINHIYNLNDSAVNDFGLGFGWRTNYHQRVYETNLTGEICYRWEDDDGTDHYFFHHSGNIYKDEDGLELTLTVNNGSDPARKYTISNKLGETRQFDTLGRLTYLENNQQVDSFVKIEYTAATTPYIKFITDGANRVYEFTYDPTWLLLTRIDYRGNNNGAHASVQFAYSANSDLSQITDNDNAVCEYGYHDNHILQRAKDIDNYQLIYNYNIPTAAHHSWQVQSVSASQNNTRGGSLALEYAHNQTKFTDHNGNVEIMQFNDYGNTVSVQDGLGRAQFADYALNNSNEAASATSTQKANQMTRSSKLQNTVQNYFLDSSFESNSPPLWTVVSGSGSRSLSTAHAYMGTHSQAVTNSLVIRGGSLSVSAGQTYTFSAYVKTGGAYATVYINDGTSDHIGQTLFPNNDWTRLEASYTNNTGSTVTVTARLQTEGSGVTYMDCIQGEKMETASRYTLIDNGDFRYPNNGWGAITGIVDGASPAPQLSNKLYHMTGSPTAANRISQVVPVSGQAGDVFVVAGWAKGDSAPVETRNTQSTTRQFGIIGTFTYADNTTESFTAEFNPDNHATNAWQYSAEVMIAQKAYKSIMVEVAYDYNVNDVYFDGIQLFKEEFGNSYVYDEKGDVKTAKDLQGQTTSYEYNDDGDLYQIIQDNKAKMTYTYDDWHNVKTAVSDEGLSYSFEYDVYGNNTVVAINSGGTKIESTATYTDDHNRLAETVDALGKTTIYDYDAQTNILKSVQYPEDTPNTATTYTYDAMYRMASAAATTDTGNAMSARYTYENDLLKSIATPTTTYSFDYGIFGLRSSAKVGGKTLAEYTYTNDHNKYLQSLAYSNGDNVQYTYDKYGRPTQESYYENGSSAVASTLYYGYDNDGALSTVRDSATGLTTRYYFDLSDRLMRYTEIGGDFYHAVGYNYDKLNNLTSLVESIGSTGFVTSYAYDDDNRVTSVTSGSANKAYTYDAFGRSGTQTTKHNTSTVKTDSFTFKNPAASTTSAQIHTHTIDTNGFDKTYTYTYDDNGNITSISDGATTTTYVYDSANQLIRENNQAGGFTHVWAYDAGGNIDYRKEYPYTTATTLGTATKTVDYSYDNSTNWKDRLVSYNGKTITYESTASGKISGNIRSDGTWTYNWQKGRQLASMTSGSTTWSFTYNADGLRTKRTNGSTTYNYIYNGDKLSQMTVGNNTLNFAYDASGTPLTVTYNNTVYYYVTNIQGDVIAILNSSGSPVVTYTYDAWGKVLSTSGSMASTLGSHNPLTYRSYVYDRESGLYYLQSRYYNPEIGRFINTDAFATTGQGLLGNNMFAYCGNNPTNRIDPNGNSWLALIIAAAVCVVTLSGCADTKSGPYSGKANCYAYALNLEHDPNTGEPFSEKPQPGTFSGNPLTEDELVDAIQNGTKQDVEDLIIGRIEADCAVLGYSIREVDSADSFPGQGHWLIALGYSTSGKDYHFWKKYGEPVWFHKPGTGPIMQVDWSHGVIVDPAQSNRGVYDQFIGYYSIGLG